MENPEYSATLQADVICRGYVCILLSARFVSGIQGGTADSILFVLDRMYHSVKGVFYVFGRKFNIIWR